MDEAGRGLPVAGAHLSFGRYVHLVCDVLDVPSATVSIVTDQPSDLAQAVRELVVSQAAPVAVSDARQDERLRRFTLTPGSVACLGVPLISGGGVFGALCALDDRPREWTDRDVHLLIGLGAACSAELTLRDSRAQAQAREQQAETARVAAEQEKLSARATQQLLAEQTAASQRSALHSRLLLSMSEALTATSTVDNVVDVVQEAAAGYLDAESARFEMNPDDNGKDPERTLRIPLSGALSGRLALTWATPEAARPWLRAGEADSQAQAQIAETVAALTHYASTALDRALLLQERRSAAATLQHAMLTTLPERHDAELAARYVPAAVANQVGGDWYDAIALPGSVADGLAVVIGDVAGHDIEAAATMGQVRSILRGLLVDSPQLPAQMISRLDAALNSLGMPTSSSLVLAMLHEHPERPGLKRLSWSSAGHPPPIRISAEGGAAVLSETPDLLLGIPLVLPRHTRHAELNAGDTLILYTDGLIQRPGHSLASGQRRLMASAVRHHHLPLAQVLDRVVEDLVTDAPDDDCAILAVRLPGRSAARAT